VTVAQASVVRGETVSSWPNSTTLIKEGNVALFAYGETTIYYDERGSGFPLLLIAPGAMNSAIGLWSTATINPLELYSEDFRLVAMDQRNAGRSSGPLEVGDPWGAYARDQLALLDHLGIQKFHVLGACIGSSFALKLIEQAPERVAAAVLQQPVGIYGDNEQLFDAMWRGWADQLMRSRADLDRAELEAFGTRMWAGEFVLSVSRDFVRDCSTPLLVLPGVDRYHPTATGREIAALARHALLVEPWKDPQHVGRATVAVREFLKSHVQPS
jgi:pimeloyl-ACP methyl ester carboxylesterase